MKKNLVVLLILAVSTVSLAQLAVNPKPVIFSDAPVFNWAATVFDFGKVKLNAPATHEFTFTNKGNAPLIISNVKASCGCTVTEYTKEAIAPGQKGFVKATYNSAHEGTFTKTVTINANTDEAVVLTIKGEVTK